MKRIACAMALSLVPLAALAQEAVGTMTMDLDGDQRSFVVIQGGEGPNPGTRYSRIGQDVSLTVVGVSGERPVPPGEAEETLELRFTVAEEGPEVRTGSVVSYSTRDADSGVSRTRGGTAEISIDELSSQENELAASGSFTSQLAPDEESAGTDVEGTFRIAMKSREALGN